MKLPPSFLILLLSSVAAVAYPFEDRFEDGLGAWNASGTWGLTTVTSVSPSHAVCDSPLTHYTNNTDSSLTLATGVSLAGAIRPVLRFYHGYALELFFDFATVEVSTNGGSIWLPLPEGRYSGECPPWTREQLDLQSFAGQSDLRVRFHLTSDGTVTRDGWMLDDVLIGDAPAPVTLGAPTNTAAAHVCLDWSPAATPGASCVVLRGREAAFDWRTAATLAVLDGAATNFVDITACPKTHYYYRIMVLATNALHSLSNERAVLTDAGTPYPFVDNGEGGSGYWTAETPWQLSTEDSHSAGHAWSDSPGTNYANQIDSLSLTLTFPFTLTGAHRPVLKFHHRYAFAPGDVANLELSTNAGVQWTRPAYFTGTQTNWTHAQLSLATYTNAGNLLLRYRITSDSAGNDDGWHVDDISVSEEPAAITGLTFTNLGPHQVTLNWDRTPDTVFSHYAIRRATNDCVTPDSALAATIANPDITTFTDTNLPMDTRYYYRVFVVNPYGACSLTNGPTPSIITPIPLPPLSNDFAHGTVAWIFTGTWGVGGEVGGRGDGLALLDSPGGDYTNGTDSAALTAVNLVGCDWPLLRFHDRYRLAAGDWGYLEVSPTGTDPWTRLYGVGQGSARTNWAEQVIDLSPWRNQSNLRLRFHLTTDGAGVDQGWAIDDLSVSNYPASTNSLPYEDSFEGGPTHWLGSSWTNTTVTPYEGANAATFATLAMPPNVEFSLPLNAYLNAVGTTNPAVVFWIKGTLGNWSSWEVDISRDNGLSWAVLSNGRSDYGWNAPQWVRVQAPLAPEWRVSNLRLRLRVYANHYQPPVTLWVDKFTVEELPAPLTLSATPGIKTVALSWTPSSLGPRFQRYLVYRSTDGVIDENRTLIADITNPATTNITDTGLALDTTYYYGVYVADTRDGWTLSPVTSARTLMSPLSLPVAENFTNADHWYLTGTWGVGGEVGGRGDGLALLDSPGGDYTNGTDSAALTAINLVGCDWPLLRFHDRYRLAAGDWGYLEVSPTGTDPWTRLYGVGQGSARTNWAEQVIDLSPWRNQSNLRLRFHLTTDGAGVDQGWAIDDLSVSNYPASTNSLPYEDSFEGGPTHWLGSSWTNTTVTPYEGANAATFATLAMPPNVEFSLPLNAYLNAVGTTNPAVVFWIKGTLGNWSSWEVDISRDNGLSWAVLSNGRSDYGWNAPQWVRVQAPLAPEWRVSNLRLRLRVYANHYQPPVTLWVDKFTVEELPAPLTLSATPGIKTVALSWTPSSLGPRFQRYLVYRSTDGVIDENRTLIANIANPATTNITDTGLIIGNTYYYGVIVEDIRDGHQPSANTVAATTIPVAWTSFTNVDENPALWNSGEPWGFDSNTVYQGAFSLNDSPGSNYADNATLYLSTSVNLAGSDWPLLKFADRFRLAAGDYAFVEVSPDGGSWTRVYGLTGQVQTEWTPREVDLSPWKNQQNLRVRLGLISDGSYVDDGWFVDALGITNAPTRRLPVPFFDGFEKSGLTNWIGSQWLISTNLPYAGSRVVEDAFYTIPPNLFGQLNLRGTVDLTACTNPAAEFRISGLLPSWSTIQFDISTTLGQTWQTLWSANPNTGWATRQDWTPVVVNLSAYRFAELRFRFVLTANHYWPTADIRIDSFGIGDAPPGPPSVLAPTNGATVSLLRPRLTVANALDAQGDALTYEYEVFDDAALTNRLAHVPAVASGEETTGWSVDMDLPNNHPYWWRCRARDAAVNGPWCTPGLFYVIVTNTAPEAVTLIGPPNGTPFEDVAGLLVWTPSVDPDITDTVYYQIQVAGGQAFTNLVIDDDGIAAGGSFSGTDWALALPLGDLDGSGGLVAGHTYFWRMRARDQGLHYSPWSAATNWFYFGVPPPDITRFDLDPAAGRLNIDRAGSTRPVRIEFSPSLLPADWQPVAGPFYDTNLVIELPQTTPVGFYRIVTE